MADTLNNGTTYYHSSMCNGWIRGDKTSCKCTHGNMKKLMELNSSINSEDFFVDDVVSLGLLNRRKVELTWMPLGFHIHSNRNY